MTLVNKNGLKGTYRRYQSRQVKGLCDQIPEERKEGLLEEIKIQANLLGYNNQSALKSAIKHLKPPKEKPNNE